MSFTHSTSSAHRTSLTNSRPCAAAMFALVSVCAIALSAPGCASKGASAAGAGDASGGPSGGAGAEPKIAMETKVPPLSDGQFGALLMSLDRRVDEFVVLMKEPGEEPRGRRTILAAALASDAGRNIVALQTIAADPQEDLRRRIAVKVLAFSTDKGTTKVLSDVLATATDTHLLTSAGFGLSRLRDPNTPLAPLVNAAGHRDRAVRNNALLALWHILDARGELGAAPLDAGMQETMLATIENALFDPEDPLVRGHAAAAMGALGDTRGVDPLMNLLRDTDNFVRMQTALALGKIGDRRAADALVDIIDETPRGNVRDAVTLGVSLLIEKHGFSVPASMGDDERSWRAVKERTLGRTIEVPNVRYSR